MMARKKRRQFKIGAVGWAVAALVFLGGWYVYQNYFAGQELEIYEASLPLAPKEIVQEWTFDNLATAWEPVNFSRYAFGSGVLIGTINSNSYLETRAIKRGLTPASAVYSLRVTLSYQPSKEKKDVLIQELQISEEFPSKTPSPSPVTKPSPTPLPTPVPPPPPSPTPKPSSMPISTPVPRPSQAPVAFELSWEMLDDRRQVVIKDSQIVTAMTTLTEIYLELPQLPDVRSARTLRLYPAVNASTGLTVTIDKIVLEEAKIIVPTPAPTITVTGKMTKPTLEGSTFYQLTDSKNKSYYLASRPEFVAYPTKEGESVVKKPDPMPSWDKYVGKNVTVTGQLYPANPDVVSFMPDFDKILVAKIAPATVVKPKPSPRVRPKPTPKPETPKSKTPQLKQILK